MLGIGFKVSDTPLPSLRRPLREFLVREYGVPEAPEVSSSSPSSAPPTTLTPAQDAALEQFLALKADVDLVRTPSALSRHVLLRYYAQLGCLGRRFPIDDALRLTFTWNDSFCPRKRLSQASLALERAAVLFNVGALESQLGVQTDRSTPEGLKTACRHFMRAAGAFGVVRDELLDQSVTAATALTPDLSAEGLGLLHALMLAQAQACFYEKAIQDQLPHALKAKLVHQALVLYQQAHDRCGAPPLEGTIDRMWGVHVRFQTICLRAATQYWQARAVKDAAVARGTGYGEEICRLELAVQACEEARKLAAQHKLPAGLAQSAGALERVVREQLAQARKDNASVYLENVPRAAELAPVGLASMVKPQPPTPDELEAELTGGDLFVGFVPRAVVDEAAAVRADLGSLVEATAARVQTSHAQVQERLRALGLPAALEALERTADAGLPPGLWTRIARIQSTLGGGGGEGGAEAAAVDPLSGTSSPSSSSTMVVALRRRLGANDEASETAERQLRDIEAQLAQEEVEDQICRQNYGPTRWPRPPSATLSRGFREDVDRFYRLVKEAKTSDRVVGDKLTAHMSQIARLGAPKATLDAGLPPLAAATATATGTEASSNGSSASRHREALVTVSDLLLRLGALAEEKAQVQRDFVASFAKFDALPVLVAHANQQQQHKKAEGEDDENPKTTALARERAFFQEHFVDKVECICQDETAVLAEVVEAHGALEATQAADPHVQARQRYLQDLGDGLEVLEQLDSHLKEGAKFYEELTTRLAQLRQTVADHCAARDLERREMELHVAAADAQRQREARDAAVAEQMMRDMQLQGGPGPTSSLSADEALARRLAGTTPQQFAATAAAGGRPESTTTESTQPTPTHPYAMYQHQQQHPPHQQQQQPPPPPPSYNSVFATAPTDAAFGNYYAQTPTAPAYGYGASGHPHNGHNTSSNRYAQYPGAGFASYQQPPPQQQHHQQQQQQQYAYQQQGGGLFPRPPPGGSSV